MCGLGDVVFKVVLGGKHDSGGNFTNEEKFPPFSAILSENG